jgi:hypothetical protein
VILGPTLQGGSLQVFGNGATLTGRLRPAAFGGDRVTVLDRVFSTDSIVNNLGDEFIVNDLAL